MCIEIYQGIETKRGISTTHFLKILKNIYEQRQVSWLCNQHFTKGIEKIGFRKSRVDDCMFYQREVEFIVFVGNGIFAALNDAEINQAIIEIGLKFDIED